MMESIKERRRRLLLTSLELEEMILKELELELVLKVLKLVLKMHVFSLEQEQQLTKAWC